MSLTLLRYRESPVVPQAVVEVNSPQDAVSLLRAWQQSYPQDSGMVLDDRRQPIATTQPAPATSSSDERLAPVSRVTRLLRRPELGALMGAVAVFILFAITDASPNHLWLHQPGLAAWTQQAAFFGILAVPVGLLMIGGEFDLSTGVMSGVTAIVMALLVGKYHWNTWLAIVGTLVFATVNKNSVDAFFTSAQEKNLRMIAGKVMMDRNAPAALTDTAETGYAESRELIRRWHGRNRQRYAVTPRFAMSIATCRPMPEEAPVTIATRPW